MNYDFYLVDAYNMAYRQWWALKDMKYNEIHTGLEFGFIKKIVQLLKLHKEKLYLAWDGKPVRCSTLAESYKSERVKVNGGEPPWTPRLERIRIAFNNVCNSLYHPEEEADEQIARFVLNNKDKKILIISNDKDLQQFVNSNVNIESGKELINGEKCLEKWGVPAYKIPLYKALDGDGSDNIKAVPRLLTKTKIKLVNMSSTIDELISNFNSSTLTATEKTKLNEHIELVKKNYSMVNLFSLEGIYQASYPNGNKALLQEIIDELGLFSISLKGIGNELDVDSLLKEMGL